MAGAVIRRLTERDIDTAIALTDLEAWGYTREDFLRLLALSPEGCFAAESDGAVVGLLTTTRYNGLAFLGAVIVHPGWRGKGLGKRLMEAALGHLDRAGVATVRLNAYLHVVPFYERLGFVGEYEVARWEGAARAGGREGVRRVRGADLPALAVFDAPFFGASRRPLLERLASEFPATFLVAERAGRIAGYIVGNVSGPSCEIGPWVVEPGWTEGARRLFAGLVASSGRSEFALTGPLRNAPLVAFVREAGFRERFRTLRMRRGPERYSGNAEGIWAAGGLEKG